MVLDFPFFLAELSQREAVRPHLETIPTAPHLSFSHHFQFSSASPARMFLSDTKIKIVGISPFCFQTVLH